MTGEGLPGGAGPAWEGKSKEEQVQEGKQMLRQLLLRGAAGVGWGMRMTPGNDLTRTQALQLFHSMAFGRENTGQEINQ